MAKKLLDFQAKISDVEQINPLFSTCKVRILYTGRNRNMSTITRESVERALPSLKNIPIVGEFSQEKADYKGHGGAIDLDSWDYIHTTKPYGVVPESATYEWEEVKGRDGIVREYLTIHGCYLWTGRYEEANTVIQNGKGQSMEIEIIDGEWDEDSDSYLINNFIFSALCILGDDVEPAFEDASITAYSFNKEEFKSEFTAMLNELKFSLEGNEDNKKEDEGMLKEILEKYSLTVEDLTAKGIEFDKISEDELEDKIIELFEIDVDSASDNVDGSSNNGDVTSDEDDVSDENDDDNDDSSDENFDLKELQDTIDSLEKKNSTLQDDYNTLLEEVESLREFKIETEKKEHESKVSKMFKDFQLNEQDVEGLDIHKFTIEEIEEKCYAILGKKLASKKNFSKKGIEDRKIHLPLDDDIDNNNDSPYGELFDKYNK